MFVFVFVSVFFLIGFSSIITYLLLLPLQAYLPEQNLANKYQAEWALVTGGSSGIGLAIVEKLARQGVNVVVAALDDRVLSECLVNLAKTFPERAFRCAGVNLSASDSEVYMDPIRKATADIKVNLVFNNAGIFFHGGLVYRKGVSYERMIKNGQKGLVAFTSSSGGFLPTPMTTMYSSTKAFLTTFAASLAGELADDNIDVLVIHPSPIASNFYSNTSLLNTVSAFQKLAVQPAVIAELICRNAGRVVVVDQGWVTVMIRLVTKVMDWNLLTMILATFSRHQDDFKRVKLSHTKKST